MLVAEPSLLDGKVELDKDEIVGVFGRNGAGKTTLMMTILCLKEGNVTLDGEEFCATPKYSEVGFVSQNPQTQVLGETCKDEIEILSNFTDPDEKVARKLMGDFYNVPFRKLSDGYKKRFVLSSSLSMNPKYVLMDEPFANLDNEGISVLAQVIPNGTMLSEHRVKRTIPLINRSYLIKDGRIVEIDKDYFLDNDFLRKEGLRGFPLEPIEHLETAHVLGEININGTKASIHRGEILCIEGKNGSGKTTALKRLVGKKNTYVIFQNPDLQFFNQTVKEEIGKIETMKRLGLAEKANVSPFSLSHGEKMKVLIGSALSSNADIIALDEPASGLDGSSLMEFRSLAVEITEEGKGIIITTNDDDIEPLCSRIVRLDE